MVQRKQSHDLQHTFFQFVQAPLPFASPPLVSLVPFLPLSTFRFAYLWSISSSNAETVRTVEHSRDKP
jgi:hypothetical protein